MRLSNLSEADMSRRQFLKTSGQAAMAAAAPKSALKGLVGASKPAAMAIPPPAMKAALLKWIQNNKLEQFWRNLAKKENAERYNKADFEKSMAERKAAGKKYFKGSFEEYLKFLEDSLVETFRDEILSNADPIDEPAYIEDLQHILDDRADERMTNGLPLPDWVTRYRVSQWMGRDVGMNHPFVQDRARWLEHFHSGVYSEPDPVIEKEFDNIIRTSMSPARYKETYEGNNTETPESDEDQGFTQADYDKAVKDKKEFEGPEYNSGNWSSQSVEFENRLRRLL